jgi:hypothetical protein
LLIGVALSGGLVTWLSHWLENRRKEREIMMQDFWRRRDIEVENRRKEHEIKVDIVSKMDETAMGQLSKALSLTSKPNQKKVLDQKDAETENIKNWYFLEAKRIYSELNTYFPGTNLDVKWDAYARALMLFNMALFSYLLWSNQQDKGKQDMVKPFTEPLCQYIKKWSLNEKNDNDLITQITSNFNTDSDLVSNVIAMFFARGEYMKRNIMEARIEIL